MDCSLKMVDNSVGEVFEGLIYMWIVCMYVDLSCLHFVIFLIL